MNSLVIQKRYVTLIEMMIVMFLIALILGVLAYNYRGTLEEGKAFKTKTGIEKVETILNLAVAQNPDLQNEIESKWQEVVSSSAMGNPSLVKDGWGYPYQVTIENGRIVVRSERYEEYIRSSPSMFGQEK